MKRPPLFLALAVIAALACNREPQRSASDTGLVLPRSARAKDSLILLKDSLLASRERQLSEQSQVIGDVTTSLRLISEINGSLAKVRGLKVDSAATPTESAVATASTELTALQRKVTAVVARLNASEARVRRMRNDSTAHATWDSTQIAQLRDAERSIGELRASVEQQRREIGVLTQRVDSMVRVNVALAAHRDSVVAVNRAMAAHNDSVFVAIGTEQELAARGIIRREGGTKLLFGRGKTIVPARTLDLSAFQVISKTKDQAITLPTPDKAYRIVSRQDLAYTDVSSKDLKVRGALRITDPERFWATSKYLILVQQ